MAFQYHSPLYREREYAKAAVHNNTLTDALLPIRGSRGGVNHPLALSRPMAIKFGTSSDACIRGNPWIAVLDAAARSLAAEGGLSNIELGKV